MSNIDLAEQAEQAEQAERVKDQVHNIPEILQHLKSLMKWAKLLGIQIMEFHYCNELFIQKFLLICERECKYPSQDHPFWKFLLTDDRCYGEFDYSQISSDEFVEFKRAYLENLQIEIDARLKSFEDQCPIAELEKLKQQFDEVFQKYNEITQRHNSVESLSSLGSDHPDFCDLKEILDLFSKFESKFSECQEKIDVLEANMVEWGSEKEPEMEDIFNSFVESITENDGEGCWTDLDVIIFDNIEYRDLFTLQRVQRMISLELFGGLFVDKTYINRDFLEEDYTDDDFQREMREIAGY